MATKKEVQPTIAESIVAETKLLANQESAVVRGWNAITPEVIELARASSKQRTEELTAHYLKRFA